MVLSATFNNIKFYSWHSPINLLFPDLSIVIYGICCTSKFYKSKFKSR